jgi:hypothetical protein
MTFRSKTTATATAGFEQCGEPGKLVSCPEVEKYRVHDLMDLLVSSKRGFSSPTSSCSALL